MDHNMEENLHDLEIETISQDKEPKPQKKLLINCTSSKLRLSALQKTPLSTEKGKPETRTKHLKQICVIKNLGPCYVMNSYKSIKQMILFEKWAKD